MKELRASQINDRERRFIPGAAGAVELRANDGADPVIGGHGALFDRETVIYGIFRERIAPGAFKDSLKEDGDVRVAFNHDPNYILGRTSAGTATVEEDDKGLRYEATPPSTRADVIESIKRKDITGSSFQFTVESDEDEEWDYSETKQGKLPLRTIKRARLYEVGPVAFPAYEDTTVSARAKSKADEVRAQETAAQAEAAAAAIAAEQEAAVGQLDVLLEEIDLDIAETDAA